jgi:hypothetical protein
MEDVQTVQFCQPLHNLHEDVPDLLLPSTRALLLVLDDLVAEVTLSCILHNNA